MSGGQFSVPLVIRMTTGAGRQLAAQHSHSLEGWYAHIPGLHDPRAGDDRRRPRHAAGRRCRSRPRADLRARVALRTSGATLDAEAGRGRHRPCRGPPSRDDGDADHATAACCPRTLAAADALAARGDRRRGARPARLAPARRRRRSSSACRDAPRRRRRRRLAQRQHRGRDQRRGSSRAPSATSTRRGAGVLRRGARCPTPPTSRRPRCRASSGSSPPREETLLAMGEFRMPSLGADMDRGTLVEWRVQPGDRSTAATSSRSSTPTRPTSRWRSSRTARSRRCSCPRAPKSRWARRWPASRAAGPSPARPDVQARNGAADRHPDGLPTPLPSPSVRRRPARTARGSAPGPAGSQPSTGSPPPRSQVRRRPARSPAPTSSA